MAARHHRRRQNTGDQLALGCVPVLDAVPDGLGLDHEFLYVEIRVALEAAALGNPLRLDYLRPVDLARRAVPVTSPTPLTTWRDRGLSTIALPPDLRRPWNAELKKQAIQRLKTWFEAQQLPMPPILVKSEPAEVRIDDLDALRKYVLDCVRVMTRDVVDPVFWTTPLLA